MEPKYISVLACRNEERLIRGAVENVLRQTVAPSCFVVVDDGSEDETTSIVEGYRPEVTLLRLRMERIAVRGVNQSLALMRGVGAASKAVPDWDYMLKIDADSYLPPRYVEQLIARFEDDSLLGVTSGVPFGEKLWKKHASDGAKIYRRGCWDDIGGLDPVSGFDLHALLKAWMKGWRVASFPEIRYEQKRSWEKRTLSRWMLTGLVRYKFGYSLFHTALASAISLRKRPRILGGLVFFLTFLIFELSSSGKPFDAEFYSFMDRFCKEDARERLDYVLRGALLRAEMLEAPFAQGPIK